MPRTTRVTTQSKHGMREERSDSSDPEYEDSAVESRADGGAVPAFPPAGACAESGAPVGMEKILATVMETFVRTQAENNRIFIETMRSLQGTTESTPTASSPVASTSAAPGGVRRGSTGKHATRRVDTGATHCIASPMLYSILRDSGVQVCGSGQSRIVATGIVPVILGDKEIITEFMVFPGDNTRTLLGRDFIARAGIVLDIGQESYFFSDDPDKKLPFAKSFVLNSELMRVDVSDVSLRENEGTELSSDQRATFNKFLRGRKDQFATEGPPTEFTTHKIRLSMVLWDARDVYEKTQAMQKKYADENRRPAPDYQVEDLVLLKTRGPNEAGKGQTPKFIPRRDGPYRVRKVLSATTYELERVGVGRSGRVALSPGRPAGGPAGGPPSPVGAHASYQKDVCIVFLRDSHYFIEVVLRDKIFR
ncbi:unnamed protein product, partial [Iphiclides podalirius]